MAETKKKPAFGGVTISFAGQTATLEQVFGKKPLAPTALPGKLWAFIRENGLKS